jgi:glycosyltransferase involved in cell wall biosynthesis
MKRQCQRLRNFHTCESKVQACKQETDNGRPFVITMWVGVCMEKIGVIMVGPISGHGGVASVIVILDKKLNDKFYVNYIDTHVDPGLRFKCVLVRYFMILINSLKMLSNEKVQIVHIHTSAGFSFVRKSIITVLSRLYSKKVILHFHASRFYDFYIDQRNPFLRCFIRFIFKRADCVVTLCYDWKRSINRLYEVKNSKVIYNPIDSNVELCISFKDRNKINLLFMGEFSYRKGIVDLLDTAVLLKNRGADFTLYLCGDGFLGKYIDNFIKDHGMGEYIINCGWVGGDRKKHLLSNTDIFVLPSYNEGVPIAILEAFAYGIPVISTKISGIPEVVIQNRNGFLIKPGDKIGLCNSIMKLIDNAELRIQFGLNNLTDVHKYSISTIASQWHYLYESLT